MKGLVNVAITLLAPALLAVAAAITLAPVAMADDADDAADVADSATSQQADDDDNGKKDVSASGPARKPAGPARTPGSPKPQDVPPGWSNEALWSNQTGGSSNPFGSLPQPPIFALD